MRSTRLLLACLIPLSMTSCAGPSDSGCSWVSRITVADADVITPATARQIVAHNRAVKEFCR